MFDVGDKVVYPMYGAGVVLELEHKVVNGVDEKYYVIDIPQSKMIVRLSCDKAIKVGLREVMDMDSIVKIIFDVKNNDSYASENWTQRYKENMEKIRSGEFTKVAEVYKSLALRERKKGLSGAEKKMLSSIKMIAVSEISYSNNIEKISAEKLLSDMLMA